MVRQIKCSVGTAKESRKLGKKTTSAKKMSLKRGYFCPIDREKLAGVRKKNNHPVLFKAKQVPTVSFNLGTHVVKKYVALVDTCKRTSQNAFDC